MEQILSSRFFRWLMYILTGILILYLLQQIKPMLSGVYHFMKAVTAPFIIAMIVSYVLNPVVSLLNERRVPRTVAVLLIYALFLTSVTVIVMNLTPMFLTQLKQLNEHLPELTSRVQEWARTVNENYGLPATFRETINGQLDRLQNMIANGLAGFIGQIRTTINLIFVAFIIPFLVFYMLKDFKLLERTLLTLLPKNHRREGIRLISQVDKALGSYVRGQFTVCLVVGFLAYIGYWIIGMPYPLLLASVVAVFNIIPYLGPFFGAAPAIIVASTISWKMVLLTAVTNLLVQVLEGNVIAPQIVGKSLRMHPLTIIFVLLVGGELAGIVGLILAVPVFAVIKVIFDHLLVYYIKGRTHP